MRAKKVDNTQAEIVAALRAASISVFSIHAVGRNVPDLVCSHGGFTALAECKTGTKKLHRGQEQFRREWQGAIFVARTGEQAVKEFSRLWALDRLGKLGQGNSCP